MQSFVLKSYYDKYSIINFAKCIVVRKELKWEVLKSWRRASVRQYKDQAIEPEKRAELERLTEALNRQYGLHMQIIYDDPACFKSIMAHYGKFEGVSNYIALVGPKSLRWRKHSDTAGSSWCSKRRNWA